MDKLRILVSGFFVFFIALYVLIRSLDYFMIIHVDFLSNHLADYCAMPVVLVICLASLRLIKKDSSRTLPIWFVFAMTIYWSVYFEWMLPGSDKAYTADILDVFAYFLGSVTFVFWQSWITKVLKMKKGQVELE